ncbi:MAG: hypothetical protein GY719_29755 [bacterium]|nr:hypothetical protein [bacterium]
MTKTISLPPAISLAGLLLAAAAAGAQSLNIDVGESGSGPPSTYAAAGRSGVWNSMVAAHGTTEGGLVDLQGNATPVTLRQIGGLELLSENDPAVSGADALLMDDFLVTYDAGLESCIFLDHLEPGAYEVLVYARMPDSAVDSYSDVDQEEGNPHSTVGGVWPGQHQELVSYSRHLAMVTANGELNLHSGIVPAANQALGAALNALQVLRLDDAVFADGFESSDLAAWN